jgi:hypothetical protein
VKEANKIGNDPTVIKRISAVDLAAFGGYLGYID